MHFGRKPRDTVSDRCGPLGSLVRAAPLPTEPSSSTTRSTNRPPTTHERGWSARLNRWRATCTTTNGKDSPPSQNQADTSTNKGSSRSISSVASQFPALTSQRGPDADEAQTKRTSSDLPTKNDYIEPSQRQPNFEQHTNAQIKVSRAASTRPGSEPTSDEEMSQSAAGPEEDVWYDAPQSDD